MTAPLPIAALPALLENYVDWVVAGLIVVVGLFIYGLRDSRVFSFSRAWAISSVCFAESIRKRVLWITPLTMLGVVLVSQFQRPVDEADSVRQMLKVCLFATGVVVTITAVILACTNLPKEIENRVIFTVVTKPTTRLEIVLGKVLGFSRVSAAILLIMGTFTFIYLWSNSFSLQKELAEQLKTVDASPAIRPTMEYYRDVGLLTARNLGEPQTLQVVARNPDKDNQDMWMLGGEGDVLVPFELPPDVLIPPGDPTNTPLAGGVAIQIKMGFEGTHVATGPTAQTNLPPTIAAPTQTKEDLSKDAPITVSVLNFVQDVLVPSTAIEKIQKPVLHDKTGQQAIILPIDPQVAPNVDLWRRVYVQILGNVAGMEFRLNKDSVKLLVPPATPNGQPRVIEPAAGIAGWQFRGRFGRIGYQVRGGDPAKEPTHVAVFAFRNAEPAAGTETVPFEFRSDIERSGVDDSDQSTTKLSVQVMNKQTGELSPPVVASLEANRPIFFKVPSSYLSGGNYDVLARCASPGQYLGVSRASLQVVLSNQPFAYNLFKSLFIMWLMAILVVSVSIFASTFLSWPIAIVLTLVMLLGRWGVIQLGDALQPGIGNQVATDMGWAKPETAQVTSKVVEALAKFLVVSAKVLPDISQFASIEDLERGVAVPTVKVTDSLLVLLTFALPLTVLSYVILRNKEVAP